MTTALITGGFMLMVIILNEAAFFFREKRIRKKEFFNQFFPERIKAHEEILRIMTEGGIAGVSPNADTVIAVKKNVESLINAAHNAVAKSLLFADRHIEAALLDLISEGNAILKYRGVNEKLEPESEIAKAAARFDLAYYELLGMLRKKSGVNLIEEVFESIPQKKNDSTKRINKNAPQKKVN